MGGRTIEFDQRTGIPSFVDPRDWPEGRRIAVPCEHDVTAEHLSGAITCVDCGKTLRTTLGLHTE